MKKRPAVSKTGVSETSEACLEPRTSRQIETRRAIAVDERTRRDARGR